MADLMPAMHMEVWTEPPPQGWCVAIYDDDRIEWQATYNGHRLTGDAPTEAVGQLRALSALRELRATYRYEPTRQGISGVRLRLVDGEMRLAAVDD